MMDHRLPEYDRLPVLAGLGLPHSWGLLDPDLGTLALLTPARVTAALATVRTGERIGLCLPLDQPDPPLFGRAPLVRELVQVDRNTWDEALHAYFPQSSSQWDGFLHVRCRELGFYGGRTDAPTEGAPPAGVLPWARSGIIGRGVLLDVAAGRDARGEAVDPFSGRAITAAELAETAAAQEVQLREGDVLCVRTGWQQAYAALGPDGRAVMAAPGTLPRFDGLSAEAATARWLWNTGVSALLADNPAVEVSPGDPAAGSLHRRVLAALGIPLGELLVFDALAEACRARGAWDFLFVSVPLPLPGGIGSPANAVAVL